MSHERGHPPATTASFRSRIPKIHHNRCGGRVYHLGQKDAWWCIECNQQWKDRVIERFTDDEIEIRFHLRGDVDPEAFVIVWKTEGKVRFTSLVPVLEADKYERWEYFG